MSRITLVWKVGNPGATLEVENEAVSVEDNFASTPD